MLFQEGRRRHGANGEHDTRATCPGHDYGAGREDTSKQRNSTRVPIGDQRRTDGKRGDLRVRGRPGGYNHAHH